MIDALLSSPRARSALAGLFIVTAAIVAGHAITTGHRKPLGILALFTIVVLLRRSGFPDFYWMTLTALSLSHVRFGLVQEEFARDKWIALFALGALSVGVAATRVTNPQWPSWLHVLVLALVVLSAYSASWSARPALTFQKAGVFAVGMVIAWVGIWSFASDRERLWRIVNVHLDWLWIVFPLSILLLFLPIGGSFQGPSRFVSIFENANNLGFWGSLSLPLVFGLSWSHPVRWRRNVARVMFVTGVLCVYLAGSRGGTLGAAAGIGLYCLLRRPRPMMALGVLVGTAATFLWLYEVDFAFVTDRMQHLLRPDSLGTLSYRTIAWEIALLIAANRPWLGHGFGLSDQVFVDYGVLESVPLSLCNTWLEAYINLGGVGLALVTAVIGGAVLLGFTTWWREREGETGLLALALACTVIAAGAHAMVENVFLSLGNPWSLPFWVNVALLVKVAALARRARQARRAPLRAVALGRAEPLPA